MNALLPLAAPPPRSQLSRLQKAAVVYRMLSSLGMALPDGALTPEEEARLSAEIDTLGGVDPGTLAAVIDEFLATLGGTSHAPPALPDLGPPATAALPALPPLPGASPGEALPVMAPIAEFAPNASGNSDPTDAAGAAAWEKVIAQEDEALVQSLAAEAPEVAAVILSKLKTPRAAELLGRLPGAQARRIAYAVSLIGDIRPDVVTRIGDALAAELGREPPRAFAEGPVQRVGAILNATRTTTRNDVLEGLEDSDPDFADAVRRSIFTFANIPARIVPRDVPKIVRGIDPRALITAFAAASSSDDMKPAADFILANISQRMADSLRAEIDERDPVTEDEGETAMKEVVDHIRAMEAEGDIYFVADDD